MTLHYAEVDLAVADHREQRPCGDLGNPAVIFEPQELDVELLLVDRSGCQQRRLHASFEPLWRYVAGVTDLPYRFHLVTVPLGLPVAQRDVEGDLLVALQLIGPGDLPVAESRPAGIQSQRLGKQD